MDVTVYHRGYHGDLNETFFVGTPKPLAKKLVENTWECLEKVKTEPKLFCLRQGLTISGNLLF